MATGLVKKLRDIGYEIFLAGNKLDQSDGRPQGAAGMTSLGTGIITGLREGGFGFIARDGAHDRPDLYFNRSAVAGDGFDALRVGQHVSFGEEPDPQDRNRQRAVNVRAADEVNEEATDAGAPRARRPSVMPDGRKVQPELSWRRERV
jgi:cold shock CspA family protein